MTTRCQWAGSDWLMIDYHDQEWGVPTHDDRTLFEFLILEGAQAGLSWSTVLKKRSHYKQVFDNFEAERVAEYGDKKIASLLEDPGIIRNRLKVNSAVSNAQAFLAIQEEFGTFDTFIWEFVGGSPVVNRWQNLGEIPAHTAESDSMSRELKRRSFRFVGSTICYAYMQAVGMVNDHTIDCFRFQELVKP